MIERTLITIKPDALVKRKAGDIISRFEKEGFRILGCKMVWLKMEEAENFYNAHKGKEFYERLVEFMSSNPALVMVLERENGVAYARQIIGATDSRRAKEGTVRKIFGQDDTYNVIHASDTAVQAEWEIRFFFSPREIFSWKDKTYNK